MFIFKFFRIPFYIGRQQSLGLSHWFVSARLQKYFSTFIYCTENGALSLLLSTLQSYTMILKRPRIIVGDNGCILHTSPNRSHFINFLALFFPSEIISTLSAIFQNYVYIFKFFFFVSAQFLFKEWLLSHLKIKNRMSLFNF